MHDTHLPLHDARTTAEWMFRRSPPRTSGESRRISTGDRFS